MKINMNKKIVVNTRLNSAGVKVCVDDMIPKLKRVGHEVTRNDWDNYENYEISMFMGGDHEVLKAKKLNPKIKTVIMDPKFHKKNYEEIRNADLLLVSSIEQREAFYFLNKNIFIYYMFPETPERFKKHKKKDKIIIGYHGNKLHLNNFSHNITKALENIGEKYDIELNVIYNVKKLRKWKFGVPKNVKVNHIQWDKDTVNDNLFNCDIGLVPNFISINDKLAKFFSKKFTISFADLKYKNLVLQPWKIFNIFNILGYFKNDHIFRFKNSTNPGRIYVFSQLGIPVISDFCPSSCQIIRDHHSGILAAYKDGYEKAFIELIESSELRNKYSNNLRNDIKNVFSTEKTFYEFNKIISDF